MNEDPKPNDKNRETGYLNVPDAEPMPDRQPGPQTNKLGQGWQLQVRISGSTFAIDLDKDIYIGRSADGDDTHVGLDLGPYGGYQGGVSRRHAIITSNDGSLFLEDMNSTNGTRINGFQLTPRRKYRLRDGDEVEFARLRAIFNFVRGS